ncbi:MAG: sce7726 family protein [Ruminococcaceae bacterium]|nr:sce7726 family protein [Oscillospiraceae bacterium]
MSNNLILNRLFTIAAFRNLIEYSDSSLYSSIINKYINQSIIETNQDAITQIYNYLRHQYRNQYFYKNTILNKLLLGVHSINTSTALTEIPIAKSKADFVLINGKAVVYEIKTELDNLERLESQISNYYKAFNHVCVLTCDSYASTLTHHFKDSPIGIYVLSSQETIQKLKEPSEYNDFLDPSVMFKILNKPEYEDILMEYYKELPTVSQVKYYSECKKLFMNIEPKKSYQLFLKTLKSRNMISNKQNFASVPYELKSLVYFSQYNDSDYENLNKFLSTKNGGMT